MNHFKLQPEDLDESLPLEPMRLNEIGEQQSALKQLLTELIETHPTKLKSDEKHKLRDTFRLILLNVVYNSLRGVYTATPRGKPSFDNGQYWNSLGLSYRFTIAALDRLLLEGYINQTKGFSNRFAGFGRLTRIYGLEKLSERINASIIEEHLDLFVDDQTLLLKGFHFDASELSPEHSDIVRLKIVNDFMKGVSWPLKAPIRLIYTGGPVRGGRLYTRFQNMPKEKRKDIKIDEKPTVELDYSANHIRMAIAISGNQPTNDPYESIAAVANTSRSIVKAFINIGLGADSAIKAFNACKRDKINKALFDLLNDATATIFPSVRLYIGMGVALQSLEGQIALDIMVEGARNDIAVLPMHDSFIVKNEHETWLRDQMVAKWMDHVSYPNVRPMIK